MIRLLLTTAPEGQRKQQAFMWALISATGIAMYGIAAKIDPGALAVLSAAPTGACLGILTAGNYGEHKQKNGK